jgi:hypothetical protein
MPSRLCRTTRSLRARVCPPFGDPLTAADVDGIKAYIGAVQLAINRLCRVIATAAGPTRV